jgi:hypothetical protein
LITALVLISSSSAQTTRPSTPEQADRKQNEASPRAKANSLASTVQMLRWQLELYRLHHDGYPTIEQFKGWRVLLAPTTPKGEIVKNPQAGQKAYGPYLVAVPSNSFTGLTEVSDAANIDAQTAWAVKKANVGRLGNVDSLFAVVPDTPEPRHLLADADWVIFSEKVKLSSADVNGR